MHSPGLEAQLARVVVVAAVVVVAVVKRRAGAKGIGRAHDPASPEPVSRPRAAAAARGRIPLRRAVAVTWCAAGPRSAHARCPGRIPGLFRRRSFPARDRHAVLMWSSTFLVCRSPEG